MASQLLIALNCKKRGERNAFFLVLLSLFALFRQALRSSRYHAILRYRAIASAVPALPSGSTMCGGWFTCL